MASVGQVNYMLNLATKKDLTKVSDLTIARLNSLQTLESLNNNQVNDILDELKAQPWLKPINTKSEPTPESPAQDDEGSPLSKAGRYFIVDPTDGVEKFVHVSVAIRASDDLYPVQEPVHRNALLQAISKDPVNSMNEYGVKLGVCGVCGRTLTRRDSRLRGMGPICAARFDSVATPEQVSMLRQLGLIKPEDEDPHASPFSEVGPGGEDLSTGEEQLYDADGE